MSPSSRFSTLPLTGRGSPALRRIQASPFPSRLAHASGRIEFVILRTGSSPPVAPHPAFLRRSYFRFRDRRAYVPKRTFTSLTTRLPGRTRRGILAPKRGSRNTTKILSHAKTLRAPRKPIKTFHRENGRKGRKLETESVFRHRDHSVPAEALCEGGRA